MKDILEELWYGNICPHEEFGVHKDEILKLMRENGESSKELLAGMDEKMRERHEAYMDRVYESCALSAADAFVRGYSLAVKMILASLAR